MNRIIFLKARWMFGFAVVLAILLVYFLSPRSQSPVLMTGLIIDILGAFILAIPDIPLFSSPFKHNLMKKAQDKLLGLSEIHRDKYPAVFALLMDVMVDIPRTADKGVEFTEETSDLATQLVIGTFDGIGVNVYDSSDNHMGIWDFGDLNAILNEELRSLEGRVRRSGISIIGFGFLLQIISMLL
ncbi:hypothetical protein DMJ13_27515 [halophilic archaeon]|nr:hypothetical protein DMJ13_27515 [halophilic archaeon]